MPERPGTCVKFVERLGKACGIRFRKILLSTNLCRYKHVAAQRNSEVTEFLAQQMGMTRRKRIFCWNFQETWQVSRLMMLATQ